MRRARCTSISPGTFTVTSSPYSRPRSGRPSGSVSLLARACPVRPGLPGPCPWPCPCCICCARLCAPRRSASSARPCASTAPPALPLPSRPSLSPLEPAALRRHHVVLLLCPALLPGPRHLRVFQHLLQLVEHALGGVLGAGARKLLHA